MAMASSTNKTISSSSSSSANLNNSSTNSVTPENPNPIPNHTPGKPRHFLESPHPNPNPSPKLPIHINPNSTTISTSRALIPFTPNRLLLNPNQDSTKTIKNPNPEAAESTNPIATLNPEPNSKSNTNQSPSPSLNPNPNPNPSPNPNPNPKPGFNPITSSNPKPGNSELGAKPAAGEHHKKRSKNWSRSETLTLIRVRTELAPRFARSGRKSELWDEIAGCLQRGHFARDAQQCRDKWEKLMAGYKEVRDGAKAPQDNPYYEELHPLLLVSHHHHHNRKREKSDDDSATPPSATILTAAMSEKNHTNTALAPAKTLSPLPAVAQPPAHRLYENPNPHPNLHHRMDRYHPFKLVSRSFRAARGHRPGDYDDDDDDDYDNDDDNDDDRDHEEEDEEEDDGDGDVHEAGRPRKLRKLAGSTKARVTSSSSSSTIDLEGLLESAIARQQSFFRELLEGIEKKEVMREQRRQEREDKWRAEERAQRVVFTQAMHVLSQRLGLGFGLGVVPTQQWPLTTTTTAPPEPIPMPRVHTLARTPPDPPDPTLLTTPYSDTPRLFPSPKRRSKNWKRAEVLHLIRLRGEMDERFSKSARRAALWTELAGELASLGINRDGKQCREKWDKLMSEYKDVVDGKKERNDSPYFVDLQGALVGGRPREAG